MSDEWQIREFAKRATNGSFCVSDEFFRLWSMNFHKLNSNRQPIKLSGLRTTSHVDLETLQYFQFPARNDSVYRL